MKFANMMGCAALALALAACGGTTNVDADGDGKISEGEASALAASGNNISPQSGKYKSSAKFLKATGMPAEMEKMMSGMMTTTFEYCLTEEMAEGGFAEMMKSGQADGCKVDRMTISGNDVDMAMNCPTGEAGGMSMAIKGEVTPTSSDYVMTMSGMSEQMGDGEIQVDVKQERIGDCD